ncbi:MAG: DUF5667 domain-containing protein [Anaerolineales bacterium]
MTPAEALAYSLREIEAGRKTAAECAQLFPDVPELENQLQDAERLRDLRAVTLSPAASRNLEARLRTEFIIRYPPPQKQAPRLGLHWWPMGVTMMLAGLLLSVVMATPGSLPGEPLYPLKRAAEQAEITLTRNAQLPTLYATLAQRRFTELEALLNRHALTPKLFDAHATEARTYTAASLASVSRLPTNEQAGQLREVILSLDQQRAAIARMRVSAPVELQADLDAVARTLQLQHATAKTQLTGLTVSTPSPTAALDNPSPVATTTVAPTGTSVATQPLVTAFPSPTAAPTSTQPPPATESVTQLAPSHTPPATIDAATATLPGNSACQAHNPHSPRYCTPTPAP